MAGVEEGGFSYRSKKYPKLGLNHYFVESLRAVDGCAPDANQIFGQLASRAALPKPLHREVRGALASYITEKQCDHCNEQSEKLLLQALESGNVFASSLSVSPTSDSVDEKAAILDQDLSRPSPTSHFEDGSHSLLKNMSGQQLSAVVRAECEMSDEMLQLVRARDFELERLRKACEKQFALVAQASTAAPGTSDENTAESGGAGGVLDKEHLSLSALNEKLRQTSASYRAQIEALLCRQWSSYRQMISRMLVGDEPSPNVQNSLNTAMRKSVSCDDSLRTRAAHSPVTGTTGLSDSFTIYVGAQLKSMHNVRIATCERLTDVCRQTGTDASSRLDTLMSLYGRELSGVVLMVGADPLFHLKTKSTFAKLCEQTTELHFNSLESQLAIIEAVVRKMNSTRRAIDEGEHSQYSIHRNDSAPILMTAEKNGRAEGQGELRPGDVYVTRHSTLSATQVVFHLVGDEALLAGDISSRHPCILGLRNIVRLASRAAVQTISLPLLLVEHLNNDATSTQWCLGRAELVFKCLKGFLMEVCSIGATASNGGSSSGFVTANGVNSASAHYNVNFLVPAQISREQFHLLIDMFTTIYHLVPSVQT